jgi:hypothetical protein
MRQTDLPSPGALSNSLRLRAEVAAAISSVETQVRKRSAIPDSLVTLKAFLNAAVARLTVLEGQ